MIGTCNRCSDVRNGGYAIVPLTFEWVCLTCTMLFHHRVVSSSYLCMHCSTACKASYDCPRKHARIREGTYTGLLRTLVTDGRPCCGADCSAYTFRGHLCNHVLCSKCYVKSVVNMTELYVVYSTTESALVCADGSGFLVPACPLCVALGVEHKGCFDIELFRLLHPRQRKICKEIALKAQKPRKTN